jgi:hypothetical protein
MNLSEETEEVRLGHVFAQGHVRPETWCPWIPKGNGNEFSKGNYVTQTPVMCL